MEESSSDRFDKSYKSPEVIVAYKQVGTNHPIAVVKYFDNDDKEYYRIMWNNKKLNVKPFNSKNDAIDFVNANAQVTPWKVEYRPL